MIESFSVYLLLFLLSIFLLFLLLLILPLLFYRVLVPFEPRHLLGDHHLSTQSSRMLVHLLHGRCLSRASSGPILAVLQDGWRAMGRLDRHVLHIDQLADLPLLQLARRLQLLQQSLLPLFELPHRRIYLLRLLLLLLYPLHVELLLTLQKIVFLLDRLIEVELVEVLLLTILPLLLL